MSQRRSGAAASAKRIRKTGANCLTSSRDPSLSAITPLFAERAEFHATPDPASARLATFALGSRAAPLIIAAMDGMTRYILRQTLAIMVFVAVSFTAAVWLVQSLRLIDLIVNR